MGTGKTLGDVRVHVAGTCPDELMTFWQGYIEVNGGTALPGRLFGAVCDNRADALLDAERLKKEIEHLFASK